MVSQPQRTPPKRHSGTARNSLGQAVAGNLFGLLAASHANGWERPAADHASGDGGALCRAPISPLPIPLGDRRSSILGDPVARRCPEMPPWSPGDGFRTPQGSMTQPYAPVTIAAARRGIERFGNVLWGMDDGAAEDGSTAVSAASSR